MAEIGDLLLEPEEGWVRYYAPFIPIAFTAGTWVEEFNVNYPNGYMYRATGTNNVMELLVKSDKIRILGRGTEAYIVNGAKCTNGILTQQTNDVYKSLTGYCHYLIEIGISRTDLSVEITFPSKFNIVAIDVKQHESIPDFGYLCSFLYSMYWENKMKLSDKWNELIEYDLKDVFFKHPEILMSQSLTSPRNYSFTYSKWDYGNYIYYASSNKDAEISFTLLPKRTRIVLIGSVYNNDNVTFNVNFYTADGKVRNLKSYWRCSPKVVSFTRRNMVLCDVDFDGDFYRCPINIVISPVSGSFRVSKLLLSEPAVKWKPFNFMCDEVAITGGVSREFNNSVSRYGCCVNMSYKNSRVEFYVTGKGFRLIGMHTSSHGRLGTVYVDDKKLVQFRQLNFTDSSDGADHADCTYIWGEEVETHKVVLEAEESSSAGYGWQFSEVDVYDGYLGSPDISNYVPFIFSGTVHDTTIDWTGNWQTWALGIYPVYIRPNKVVSPQIKAYFKFKGTDLYLYGLVSNSGDVGPFIVEIDGKSYTGNSLDPNATVSCTKLILEVHNLDDKIHYVELYNANAGIYMCGCRFNVGGYMIQQKHCTSIYPQLGWERFEVCPSTNKIGPDDGRSYSSPLRLFTCSYIDSDTYISFYTNSNVLRIIMLGYNIARCDYFLDVYVDGELFKTINLWVLTPWTESMFVEEITFPKSGNKYVEIKHNLNNTRTYSYIAGLDVPIGYSIWRDSRMITNSNKILVYGGGYNSKVITGYQDSIVFRNNKTYAEQQFMSYERLIYDRDASTYGSDTLLNSTIFIRNWSGIHCNCFQLCHDTANGSLVCDVVVSYDFKNYEVFRECVFIGTLTNFEIPRGVKEFQLTNFKELDGVNKNYKLMFILGNLITDVKSPDVSILNSCICEEMATNAIIQNNDDNVTTVRLNENTVIPLRKGSVISFGLEDLKHGENTVALCNDYGAPLAVTTIQVYSRKEYKVKFPTVLVKGCIDSRMTYDSSGSVLPDYLKASSCWVEIPLYPENKNTIKNVSSSSEESLQVMFSFDEGKTWDSDTRKLTNLSKFSKILLRAYITIPCTSILVEFTEPYKLLSEPLTVQTTDDGFKKVLNMETQEYILTLNDGIGIDDAEVDYSLYTAPGNIKIRQLDMGVVIGGQVSKEFAFEVINGYDIPYKVQLTVSRSGDDARKDGNVCYLSDSPDLRGQTRVEMSLTKDKFSPIYPLNIALQPYAKQIVYIRVCPQTLSSQVNVFQVKVSASPL